VNGLNPDGGSHLQTHAGGGLDEPAAPALAQVRPIGTPGDPVAPAIGTGVKT
jgi:hypothetical protein